MQDNKARQIRIERKSKHKVAEDENQHLWAVSYSDFLMVLLSFFLLFYSADEKNRESLVQKITHHFSLDEDNKTQHTEGIMPFSRLPASLKELDPTLVIEETPKNETVYIHFPENFFLPGQFEVNDSQTQVISKVLRRLSPIAKDLNLTFEGHSDQAPINSLMKRNKVIKSNFVLSSLRAYEALEIAKEAGFEEGQLFISASSSNNRNSRSLTIRVSQRGVTL